MFKHINLENFKSYKNADIILSPLTILCGGNSSGKTSLIKSILLMKQSFESTGSNYLLVNGAYCNNGWFENIAHNIESSAQAKQLSISVSLDIEKDTVAFKDLCKSIGMLKNKKDICRFDIHASFCFQQNPSIPQIGEISSSEIILETTFTQESKQYSGDSIVSRIKMTRLESEQIYNVELENFPTPVHSNESNEYPFVYLNYSWRNCVCYFSGMQLVSLYYERMSKKGIGALPVLYTIFRFLYTEMVKVKYIGPLRETPLRQYVLQDICSNIGIKGENTAQYLGQYGTSIIKAILPENNHEKEISLVEAVNQWATFLGIEGVSVNKNAIPGANITQIIIGTQNLADVGFGVSQVLPILVEGLTINKGDTLILEQPEIHLHPKMQMDIADFLLAMTRQGKNLIIETHSDHIINRIVRRTLEETAFRDKIRIYFVEKGADGSSFLSEVQIDEKLGIMDAPKGFFDQYSIETEYILKAGYKNMCAKWGQQ